MGALLSTSRKEARELEQLNKDRAAARVFITDSRGLITKSMQAEQRAQQFYYVGVTYYGLSMVGFSMAMLNARQRYPVLQRAPWIVFTITGYLLGGQLWGLHQQYFHCESAKLLGRLRKKMDTMQEKHPHITEYRAESSSLEKLRKECRLMQVDENQFEHSTPRLMLTSIVPSALSGAGDEQKASLSDSENPMDDIMYQVVARNKALNK